MLCLKYLTMPLKCPMPSAGPSAKQKRINLKHEKNVVN